MEGPLPAGLADPSDLQRILDAVTHQADLSFQMMVGLGECHVTVQPVPEGFLSRVWDYTGVVSTEGDLIVLVGCGLPREEAHHLSTHMMGMEIEDDELVLGCLQELLNVVLGGAIGPICEFVPVKMGLPRMNRNIPMAVGSSDGSSAPVICLSVLLHLSRQGVYLDLFVAIGGTPGKG